MNRGHLNALLCTIAESGDQGSISGHLYAALMTYGVSLDEYQAMEFFATSNGLATKRGDVLYPTQTLTAAMASAKKKSDTNTSKA